MHRFLGLSCLALALCLFNGCSSSNDAPVADSAQDAATIDSSAPDTAVESSTDAGVDSTADGAADATIDSAGDSAIDSAVDSSLDSSIADAPSDSQALDGGTTDCADSSQSDQNSPDIDAAPATLGVVSVQNLHTELTHKDFLLINVHVPNAGEIPQTDTHISYLDTAALKAYVGPDLDKKAVIYCLSNGMSVPAAQFLVDNGYRQIRYLDGGMTAWENAGYPLINP